jgi:anti-sigma regulatory factor (Ser/Thr protein kinase)
MEGTFSTRSDALAGVSSLVDRIALDLRLPRDVVTDLRIVLDEVVTNILKYAYPDQAQHDIQLRCEVRGGWLETTVEDDGIAFNPLQAPEPDVASPLESRRLGGLGVHFMKSLTSSVSYERVGGHNRLRIRQRVAREPE